MPHNAPTQSWNPPRKTSTTPQAGSDFLSGADGDEPGPTRSASFADETTQAFLEDVSRWSDPGTDTEPATEAEPAPPADFQVPGFEILRELGSGGMGVVYLAREIALDRLVALKRLWPEMETRPDIVDRFKREAESLARKYGPHVPPIYGIIEVGNSRVIVMPFIDGPSLAKVIRFRREARKSETTEEQRRQGDEAYLRVMLPLLDQLVDAVASVHAAEPQTIHRDIKPSNVMVELDGHLWLTDFGLARKEGQSVDLTASHAAVGTPGYMSPEQWINKDVGPACDVFCLGVTIYQALCLEAPYDKNLLTADAKLPVRPSKHNPVLTNPWNRVILSALHPKREHRYADAGEFQNAWQALRDNRKPVGPKLKLRDRIWRWLREHPASVAAALLLVVAGCGYDYWNWIATTRRIVLPVSPAGARVALVHLDDTTGEPIPGDITIVDADKGIQQRMKPGDYAVEVVWPTGPMLETRRHIPKSDEPAGAGDGSTWSWLTDKQGVVSLTKLVQPKPLPPKFLVPVNPPATIDLPTWSIDPTAKMWSRRGVPLATFEIGRTEITVGDYYRAFGRMPQFMESPYPNGSPPLNEPLRNVSYHEAWNIAERLGLRLPTEEEWYAAWASSAAGMAKPPRYPWGDTPPKSWKGAWDPGPVGTWRLDVTPKTGIVGLCSNVGEWTSTRYAVGLDPESRRIAQPIMLRSVIVRGLPDDPTAPAEVARGRLQGDTELFSGPTVGLRGIRTSAPRYIAP